jgi:hypothetical protein
MDKNEKIKDVTLSDKDSLNLLDSRMLSLFKDNANFVFCYKKSVKLLKAIYFITESDIFSENDRAELRLLAQRVVKDITVVCTEKRRGLTSFASSGLETLEKTLLSMFSILEALSTIGSVSSMNVAIFIAEYQQVLESIGKSLVHKKLESEMTSLTKDFFAVAKEDLTEDGNRPMAGIKDTKGQYKTSLSNMSFKNVGQGSQADSSLAKTNNFSVKRHEGASVKNALGGNDRASIILKEISEKGSVTIKDISTLMKQVSEKTVQRELISLVARGVLKKEGERRWSRYSLV